jgi:hypothetical protein
MGVVLEDLRGVNDAAACLNLSPWTVRYYWKTGQLRGVKIGRRVLFEPEELRNFVARCKANTQRPGTVANSGRIGTETPTELDARLGPGGQA